MHTEAILSRVRQGNVLWLMHVNADPDCVGSAFALREAFGGTVGAPDGMNRPGARLARDLGLEPDIFPHPERFDHVVAVDLGSRSSLGRLADRVGSPLLVDHHRYGDLHEGAPALAWDPSRASCAEVVLALLDAAGHAPSPTAARGLLAGIVTDTGRFRYGDARALADAARLCGIAGVRVEDVLASIAEEEGEEDDGLDARLAMLKAASRAEVERIGRHLLVTSHVGSHDGAAATALVRSGADVALVAVERHDLARLSLRGSPRVRGIHLGEVANAVGREIGWSAGGHEGAAGMRGEPPVARARDAVLAELRRRLEGSG